MAWSKRANNFFFIFADMVIKPVSFDRQPDALAAMRKGGGIN
jgi:hypothetical protein